MHGPNIPESYAILLFTAKDLAFISSPIHTCMLFLLWLHPFILSGVISPLSPVAYWPRTNLGSSSFSVLSFCHFILFMGFSRQEYWSGLSVPSPVDHVLSELSTMTDPSWVVLHSIHSFIELDKAVVHVIRLTSCLWLWFQSVCPLMPSPRAYHLTWLSLIGREVSLQGHSSKVQLLLLTLDAG